MLQPEVMEAYKASLETEGFTICRGLVQDYDIDAHLKNYCSLYVALGNTRASRYKNLPRDKRISIRQAENEFHRNSPDALRLCFNPDVMSLLKFYFGEEPVLAMPQTDLHSRETKTHNDSMGIIVAPRGARVRMWMALEDIHPASGPLYVYPRSHRLIAHSLEAEVLKRRPEFLGILQEQIKPTSPEKFVQAFSPIAAFIHEVFSSRIEELGLQPYIPVLQKGDVLIFDVDLFHGSTPYSDESLTRKHLLAYWDSTSACYYLPRYYFGVQHDFRAPQTALRFSTEQTPYGYVHPNVEREFEKFYDLYAMDISSYRVTRTIGDHSEKPVS